MLPVTAGALQGLADVDINAVPAFGFPPDGR